MNGYVQLPEDNGRSVWVNSARIVYVREAANGKAEVGVELQPGATETMRSFYVDGRLEDVLQNIATAQIDLGTLTRRRA